MRVLWITTNVFEPFYSLAKGKPSRSASWTTPLFYSLHKENNIQLGSLVPILKGEFQKVNVDGIVYYSIPKKQKDLENRLNNKLIAYYQKAIDDFKPDIIHIHGVEKNFGLLRNFVDANIPIVCSIQGLVNPCFNSLKVSVATLNLCKHRSLKNWLGRGGVKNALKNWRKFSIIEKEILEINQYFIGRTLWDKSQLLSFNQSAEYFQGEELLRDPFYSMTWSIKDCTRHRVFISSAAYPLKGFHVLLKAVAILKKEFPNIQIVAPLSAMNLNSPILKNILIAEDYSNYLNKEIKRLELADNMILFSKLTADEMAKEYSKAHAFVLPSFMENSSNALGEAMLVGTPSIVSPVGGVMSIVKDEESALLFPSGDYRMLAYQIKRVFDNDELANKLSENAKYIALKRHDIAKTTEQYINIYEDVIELHTKKNKAENVF
ncbi:MAG: glycosyltransferase family 4 protein [Dysgonamonadaceae bacterium]|nr:glycosyltransferase family 4 protein [Dysgonamonadaceae bacterium]MDD4728948.1 glycosyltransferase family 4 protein [Dysgonamonadaceae bacterium]